MLKWFEGVDDLAEVWPVRWLLPGAPDQIRNGCMHCIWNVESPILIPHRTHHLYTSRVKISERTSVQGIYLVYSARFCLLSPQSYLILDEHF